MSTFCNDIETKSWNKRLKHKTQVGKLKIKTGKIALKHKVFSAKTNEKTGKVRVAKNSALIYGRVQQNEALVPKNGHSQTNIYMKMIFLIFFTYRLISTDNFLLFKFKSIIKHN